MISVRWRRKTRTTSSTSGLCLRLLVGSRGGAARIRHRLASPGLCCGFHGLPYSISSSAPAMRLGGKVSPSALAAFMLITKLAIYPINAQSIVEAKATQILDTKPKAHLRGRLTVPSATDDETQILSIPVRLRRAGREIRMLIDCIRHAASTALYPRSSPMASGSTRTII